MNLFWLEFFYFVAAIFGVLVSIAAAALFLLTYRYERQTQTVWRAIGFIALAIAFIAYILGRKYPEVQLVAIIIELFGFFAIFTGVRAEPNLSHLRKTGAQSAAAKKKAEKKSEGFGAWGALRVVIFLVLIPVIAALVKYMTDLGAYLPVALEAIALVFVIGTIVLQIRRYRGEGKDSVTKRQNLWPLLGYIFLLVRGIVLLFNYMPENAIVRLREQTLDYSFTWILGFILTFTGFLFLSIWAWNFIKLRFFLRTYVVFLAIAILVSALGSLVFTQLIFVTVERNNLDQMERGAETQRLIQLDRSDTAMLFAQTIDEAVDLSEVVGGDRSGEVGDKLDAFLISSNADILRVYNDEGTVVASPSDVRDEGQQYFDDSFVAYVIKEKSAIKTFDAVPGVLAEVMVTRAIQPIMDGKKAVGAIEVGYQFDNAYVDFAKRETNLDVTMFTDKTRSASTILTQDDVSRWVGSEETNKEVVEEVYEDGSEHSLALDRLGRPYYSAFEPIRDINGEIVGMVSVGTPTNILFEDTRQQLITTFLIATGISLLAALIGYLAILNFRKDQERGRKSRKR